MKKAICVFGLFILMISFGACSSKKPTAEDIHSKIHDKYYSIASYNTDCTVTAYTPGGENTYNCTVDYNSSDESYKIVSDDMTINLTKDKTVISKGQNVIESVASETDMYIFVNTFFKSYYESEDTVMSVSAEENPDSTLLECSSINPTEFNSAMKLWVDNKTVLPIKMQVFDKSGEINAEINFNNFKFV